jgi:hypothetical protein
MVSAASPKLVGMPLSIKQITRSFKNEGKEYFFAFLEGDPTETGRWMEETEINRPDLIRQFRAQKRKPRGGGSAVSGEGTAPKRQSDTRQIQQIRGIIADGADWLFVVRFAGAEKDEAVPKAVMNKHYPKQLLRFYEAHIEVPKPVVQPAQSPPPPAGSPPLPNPV